MIWIQKISNYIFPPRCLTCSEYLSGDGAICGDCWNNLRFIKSPFCKICSYEFELKHISSGNICPQCIKQKPFFDYSRALLKFDEKSRKLIHDFKYYDKSILAEFLARIMHAQYRDYISDIDLIIPVPMHKLRRLWRLYNHTEILSHAINNIIHKEVRSDILRKVKYTKSQTNLRKKEREKNLKNSMVIENKSAIYGKRILLIDDVATTNATINLCARLLKKAGAKSVIALCIARRML